MNDLTKELVNMIELLLAEHQLREGGWTGTAKFQAEQLLRKAKGSSTPQQKVMAALKDAGILYVERAHPLDPRCTTLNVEVTFDRDGTLLSRTLTSSAATDC